MEYRNNNQRGFSSGMQPQQVRFPGQDALERARKRKAAEIRRKKQKRKKNIMRAVIVVLAAAIVAVAVIAIRDAGMLSRPKVQVENQAAGIRITWNEIEGAEKYELSKETAEGAKILKTTDKTAYTDKKAVNGEDCKYILRAVSEKKNGKAAKFSAYRIAPVEITDTDVDENSVTLTWKGFETAKHYEIYKRIEGGEFSKIQMADPATLSYTDSDVEQNNIYYYIVRQITSRGDGPLADEKSVPTMSTKLDSASVKNSPAGVKVSWEGKADLAIGFNVYRKVKGGDWVFAGSTSATEREFIDKKAGYGKTNYYQVRIKLSETGEGEATKAGSVYAVDPSKKLVALTYDDGPYSPVTNVILDTMEKYNSHCTFFVVGDRVETYNACVTRAASLGCEVGSHTYNHKYLSNVSGDELNYQLSAAKKVIEKYSGTKCTILRPPGGFTNSSIPYPSIMWSVDTMDWSNRNTETTLANAKNHIFDGCIVLMHDLYESSGQATVSLVPYLIDKGYQLVTVSELMDARGVEMKNGVSYYQATKKS